MTLSIMVVFLCWMSFISTQILPQLSSLCWVLLHWMSLCWVSLCWMSGCHVKYQSRNPNWSGRISTVDLLALISLYLLLLILTQYFSFTQTIYLDGEVYCIEAPFEEDFPALVCRKWPQNKSELISFFFLFVNYLFQPWQVTMID